MTSQYRHRRSSNPATAFPNPLEPGEIAVNTANRQLAVGDAQTANVGAPLAMLAVRYFDARAQYAINDYVIQAGVIYRAHVAISPGTFQTAQWDMVAGALDPRYVAKAGDTMAGMLTLAGDPTLALQAATKNYVDVAVATRSTLMISDTPPVGAPDNTLWWESDTGILYVEFNDGNSRQWVVASPVPDLSVFLQKSGGTMTGPLILAADPTVPMGASTKQYVDNNAVAAANSKVSKTGDTMTGDLNGTRFNAVRSDGNYQFFMESQASPPHKYGIAVTGGVGGLTFDDITNGLQRFGISPAGVVTMGGALGVGGAAPSNAGDIGVTRPATPATGAVFFGNATHYLFFDGTRYQMNAPLQASTPVAMTDVPTCNWVASNYQPALGYTPVHQGGGGSQGTNQIYIGWSTAGGTGVRCQIDSTDAGFLYTTNFNPAVSNIRLAFAGDFSNPYNTGIQEPYLGACCTGAGGFIMTQNTIGTRYRWLQYFTNTWYTVGTA